MKELIEKINAEIAELQKDFTGNLKGSKAAGVRARKHTLALEKMFKEYRKESISIANKGVTE